MAFDIIGDIHGQHSKLIALLQSMGYRNTKGAWRHPARTVIFVGDFVDRGPEQLETLTTVRRMCDAGSAQAILGNHEFNAMAFHAQDPDRPGYHLRIREEKNRRQHIRFLEEVGEDTPVHQEWISWFKTLPLWLELPHLRVVHACWHAPHMTAMLPHLGPNRTITDELIVASSRRGSHAYEAIEAICKGLEVDLPPPVTFTDSEGHVRDRTRVRWWDPSATTYRDSALVNDHARAQLPALPLPAEARVDYDNEKPVFFGHYWFTGTPGVLSNRACCVDYSAARPEHPLVAYRWDGEQDLVSENLVSSHPTPSLRGSPRV